MTNKSDDPQAPQVEPKETVRGAKVLRACLVCGKEKWFYKKDVEVWGKGKACSPQCAHKLMSRYYSGEDNPNYVHGEAGSPEYQCKMDRVRRQVRSARRSGDMEVESCACCGRESEIAHHEDYAAPLNVTWLCRSCHGARHKELRTAGVNITAQVEA